MNAKRAWRWLLGIWWWKMTAKSPDDLQRLAEARTAREEEDFIVRVSRPEAHTSKLPHIELPVTPGRNTTT